MQLILIRHGEPDTSLDDLSDPPLTEIGHKQAQATAEHLADEEIDAIYVSPQRRALQTSIPLATVHKLNTTTDERIAEFDYELGEYLTYKSFEGMDRAQVNAKFEELQGPHFQQRVMAGMNDIIDTNPGRNIAVVCHGGVINVVLRSVLIAGKSVGPDHASVTRIWASSKGVRSLDTFNERTWLSHLPSEPT